MNIRNLLFIRILLILCTISSPKATNGSIIKLDDTSEDIKEHINDFMTQSVINVDIDLDVDYTELDFENDNTKNKNEINEEISTDIEYETYGPENELDVETDKITCCDEENKIDNSYNKSNKQYKEEPELDIKKFIIGWIFIGIFLVCCLIFSCYKHMKKIVITYIILVVFGYSLLTIVFLIEGIFWGSTLYIYGMPLWEKIILYIGCFIMGTLIIIPAFILVCCKIICCLFSDDWHTPDVYEIHEIDEYGIDYNVRYEDWNGNELPHPHNSCILQ